MSFFVSEEIKDIINPNTSLEKFYELPVLFFNENLRINVDIHKITQKKIVLTTKENYNEIFETILKENINQLIFYYLDQKINLKFLSCKKSYKKKYLRIDCEIKKVRN